MNKKITPSRFLKENVYEDIPGYKKRRQKVSKENFVILEYGEENKLIELNFNMQQLKEIARFYKQKRSCNKPQLIFILYNFLRFSKYARKIQKIYRGYLRRRYNKLRGPAFFNKKCTNETDFITLQKVKDIDNKQFISMREKDGFIFGFDICSIYNLLKNKKYNSINPYTRKPLENIYMKNIKEIIRLSKIFNEKIKLIIEDSFAGLTPEQRVELLGISVFQKIDELGNNSNSKWLLSLNRIMLLKFVKELMDIWIFRANIPPLLKRSICPPSGNPFIGLNLHQNNLPLYSLKQKILHIIENLIMRGYNRESRVLGAIYVLTALTLVSKDAAEARPELYESAVYH